MEKEDKKNVQPVPGMDANFRLFPAAHEFIGREAKVLYSPDTSLIGLSGTVVDETFNTMKLMASPEGLKIIPKQGAQFMIDGVELNGIQHRPEDRIKMMK